LIISATRLRCSCTLPAKNKHAAAISYIEKHTHTS
jgi:hypothetical protein